MRNLKKVLALVLALMMALSLMTVAGAASFEDLGSASSNYQEAVKILGALEVFKGYSEDSANFMPKQNITRAEVATIIYRIDTGDVGNDQDYLYVGNDLTDVAADHWAAGAIGYCVNKQIMKGYPDGTFKPNNSITGYEVLAMILREVGYDKNGEFDQNWPITVASTARQVGASTTLTSADSAALNQPATREVVAELLFQTMVNAEMVYPNALWNYRTTHDLAPAVNTGKYKDLTLGEFKLGLWKSTDEYETVDTWGRPGYVWYGGAKVTYLKTNNSTGNDGVGYKTADCDNAEELSTVTCDPVAVWYEQVHECDVAAACGFGGTVYFELCVNNSTPITDEYKVVATDVTTPVGGQGRLTEVYYDEDLDLARVVMIDTFLAKVDSVIPATLDAAGHVIVPATMNMKVYDNPDAPYTPSAYAMTNGKTNWTFSAGDYVLVQGWTVQDADDTWTQTEKEQYAYTVKSLQTTNKTVANEGVNYVKPTTVAESFTGTQTVVYQYAKQRDVDGTKYSDAMTFYMGQPVDDAVIKYTWFKDQYGNLIGAKEPGSSQYGVIKSIYWSIGVGDSSTTNGTGSAIASVLYADGTEGTLAINKFNIPVGTITSLELAARPDIATSDEKIDVNEDGYAALTAYYDYAGADPMGGTTTAASATADSYGIKSVAGKLMVAPYATANATADTTLLILSQKGQLGQLFKFTTDAYGTISATEVAGNGTNADSATAGYSTPFSGLWNDVSKTSATVTVKSSDSYITYDDDSGDNTGNIIFVNSNTQFVVQKWLGDTDTSADGKTNEADATEIPGTFEVFTGLANMPGKTMTLAQGTEIDWVDEDGDGIADVVFTMAKFGGSTGNSLFYATRVQNSWNYSTGQGTIVGYLDGGEEKEYVVTDLEAYTALANSIPYGAYPGRLFAVMLDSGEIVKLDTAIVNSTATTETMILSATGLAANYAVSVGGTSGGSSTADDAKNKLTTKIASSPYTATTQMIYFDGADLTYDLAAGTLAVNDDVTVTSSDGSSTTTVGAAGATFTFTNVNSGTIVTGNGLIYNLANSWVTIVYNEPNANFSTSYPRLTLQVYLTQKDNTPSSETTTGDVVKVVKTSTATDAVTLTLTDGSTSLSVQNASLEVNGTEVTTADYDGNYKVVVGVRSVNTDNITTTYTGTIEVANGVLDDVTWDKEGPTFASGNTYYITINIVDSRINDGTATSVYDAFFSLS